MNGSIISWSLKTKPKKYIFCKDHCPYPCFLLNWGGKLPTLQLDSSLFERQLIPFFTSGFKKAYEVRLLFSQITLSHLCPLSTVMVCCYIHNSPSSPWKLKLHCTVWDCVVSLPKWSYNPQCMLQWFYHISFPIPDNYYSLRGCIVKLWKLKLCGLSFAEVISRLYIKPFMYNLLSYNLQRASNVT